MRGQSNLLRWTIRYPRWVVLLLLLSASPSHAHDIPAPGQNDWVARKQFIQINDTVRMAYVEWGDPNGDPVVLIHGYSDNSRAYSTIAPYLNGKRFLAVDLRGHGHSSQPDCCYYVSDFAEDLSGFITAMGYSRADVVGHSLGSITAAVLAAIHPEQVRRLVLISSALAPGPGTAFLYETLHRQQYPIALDSDFMKLWAPTESGEDQEMLGYLRTEEIAVPKRVWLGIIKGLEILDWSAAARRITAPTLIMWGDQDQLMVESDQVALRQALPKAGYIRYSGLGHSMYWEEPERVSKDLSRFLQ